MWPKDHDGSPTMPIGFWITFVPGDQAEFMHLLNFLCVFYALGPDDFDEKTISKDEGRFPYVWVGPESCTIKQLITEFEQKNEIEGQIHIGFPYHLQPVFRAYRAHHDKDESRVEAYKEFFAGIDEYYYGTPSKAH